MRLAALLLLLSALPLAAAPRWEVVYLHDEDRTSLTINDLQFASDRRGVAVGYVKKDDEIKPMSLLTIDGGKTWTPIPIKEVGISLFFLDITHGWMVTDRGLWETAEAGRSWTKVKSPREITRVWFLTPEHGFAIGPDKNVYETTDGKEWNSIAALDQVKTTEAYTFFNWIVFQNSKIGMIAGDSRPPRRRDPWEPELPTWVDPSQIGHGLDRPHLNVLLETRDGGATWSPSSTSMFGRISRVRVRPDGESMGLVEFEEGFRFPSEVFRIDWRTGKSTRVFAETNRAITDVAFVPEGPWFLAGYEVVGKLARLPVPGRVKILHSANGADWKEMEVDYRAEARRVTLAPAGKQMFAATDTGIILRLSE